MIGGGRGAFIGNIHRMAAALDGQIELVAGAFSSDPERSLVSGKDLYLNSERVYPDYKTMIQKEASLPPETRIDLISIVTPNHMHYDPARLAIENGFHVICDKPLCYSLEQAHALKELLYEKDTLFALSYNYTGYPMVKQARAMLQDQKLGKIRKVIVEYSQGWLSNNLESYGNKQASWRTDPAKSGIAGAIGDIGTHAAHLSEYVTGMHIKSLNADVNTHVDGRKLDDDASVLLRFDNGATGVLIASQISAGEENKLELRVYGEKGSLSWKQMQPNSLEVQWLDKPATTYRAGGHDLYPSAIAHTRLPAGHPEGYIESFANIYRNVAKCIQARLEGIQPDEIHMDYPGIEDGVRGMAFIHHVIQSGQSNSKWLSWPS